MAQSRPTIGGLRPIQRPITTPNPILKSIERINAHFASLNLAFTYSMGVQDLQIHNSTTTGDKPRLTLSITILPDADVVLYDLLSLLGHKAPYKEKSIVFTMGKTYEKPNEINKYKFTKWQEKPIIRSATILHYTLPSCEVLFAMEKKLDTELNELYQHLMAYTTPTNYQDSAENISESKSDDNSMDSASRPTNYQDSIESTSVSEPDNSSMDSTSSSVSEIGFYLSEIKLPLIKRLYVGDPIKSFLALTRVSEKTNKMNDWLEISPCEDTFEARHFSFPACKTEFAIAMLKAHGTELIGALFSELISIISSKNQMPALLSALDTDQVIPILEQIARSCYLLHSFESILLQYYQLCYKIKAINHSVNSSLIAILLSEYARFNTPLNNLLRQPLPPIFFGELFYTLFENRHYYKNHLEEFICHFPPEYNIDFHSRNIIDLLEKFFPIQTLSSCTTTFKMMGTICDFLLKHTNTNSKIMTYITSVAEQLKSTGFIYPDVMLEHYFNQAYANELYDSAWKLLKLHESPDKIQSAIQRFMLIYAAFKSGQQSIYIYDPELRSYENNYDVRLFAGDKYNLLRAAISLKLDYELNELSAIDSGSTAMQFSLR